MPKKVPKSWVFSRCQKFPKCLRNRICNNIATKSLRYGTNLNILVRYDNVYTCRVFCWYTGYIIPRFGPNWAQNGPKLLFFLYNGSKLRQSHSNLVRYVIQHQKSAGDVHFCHIRILDPFWGTLGVKKGVKKGQKFPISLQMVIRTCKFGQICYSAWEIRWWCPFLSYYFNESVRNI